MESEGGDKDTLRIVSLSKGNSRLCNNMIRTAKYNALNFIPLDLFNQFKKAANVYFLIITGLQTIQLISISNG